MATFSVVITLTSLPPPQSAQVVEERRQRLQEYLRFVVRLCTEPRVVKGKQLKHQLDPIMKPSIDRDTLQDILPFFR